MQYKFLLHFLSDILTSYNNQHFILKFKKEKMKYIIIVNNVEFICFKNAVDYNL